MEVLGEHVERPRGIHHDGGDALWVRDDFVAETGRDLYRYWVNEILEEANVPFRIATTGDDAGRVVRFEGSAEQELMDDMAVVRAASTSRPSLTRFRPSANGVRPRQDKEVAIIELTGVLELRRNAILEPNLTKGELALFGVLNTYALRHKREDQITDYDEVFLDWIFIWCSIDRAPPGPIDRPGLAVDGGGRRRAPSQGRLEPARLPPNLRR